ncbi:GGDEF domain-containing protein [Ruminococcus flavefaciens]|uniref:substrate-binding and GGDEF domain-containing protein n=1 Tax=Ruminococcus flavefaciens TaxID=1265 RepID=UPI0026F10D0E|nr:GGDEF domain-containing protein [Ruminococcus flavefaciens]MDD7517558.1 GGDEF domain-containing protein [Ruminococcus flavefaciens]MDY5691529.1 GGDEF domain-containing protein [Ruminococcus flavefaciens]
MEKTIELAVIVAGIDEEYQNAVLDGIKKCAKRYRANISCFCSFSGVLSNKKFDVGEYNIFSLINYKKFDGMILMTNTISDPVEKAKIIAKVKDSGLPVTVLDCDEYPEFYNIKIDNYKAMKSLVDHILDEHKLTLVNYISGPAANPEATARYEAFCASMEEHSILIDNDRIYMGEFRAADGKKAVDQFISSGMPRPQAIICANDAMALAAIEELSNYGYKVPDDIIVTGFDNTHNARHHVPQLTTISRPLEEAGYKACEILIKLSNGEEQEKETVFEAVPVFTESCGCKCDNPIDINEHKTSAYKLLNKCRRDISLLNRMTTEIAENDTAEGNLRTVAQFIREIKCDKFCICLCSNWDEVIAGGTPSDPSYITFQTHGYTSKMSAPLILDGGINIPVDEFKSSEMQPVPLKNGGNMSYFMPLHFRERCLGYYIFVNSDFPTKSLLCHSLMLNISNSIENIRKLLHMSSMIKELDRLYVIDPLCNIYNRNGFIREADETFKNCKESGHKMLISFIDMDGLKLINDNYGHKEGDFALQCLARVIRDCCRGDRICARFGGDEFIILGENAADNDIDILESVFRVQLDNMNKVIRKPYSLDASIGTIVTDVDAGSTLFNLITKADEIMYEKKKRKKTSRYLRKE